MKELFPEYFPLNRKEQNALWEDPFIVFDTNFFLNLYNYQAKIRNRMLSDLWKIRKRLWIPAHVPEEYLSNRTNQIEAQSLVYRKLQADLKKMPEQFSLLLGKKSLHPTLNKEVIRKKLENAARDIVNVVEGQEASHVKHFVTDSENDPILERLSNIYRNRIGRRWSTSEFLELVKEGEIRYPHEVPPGYEDLKKDFNRYGDLLIWKQLLEWASTHNKPIIFVTDDSKSDWWTKNGTGEILGPRAELIAEHLMVTGNPMYAYKQEDFWKLSSNAFGTKTNLTAFKEIRRVEEAAQEELSSQAVDPITYGGGGTFFPSTLLGIQALKAFGGAEGISLLANNMIASQALKAFGGAEGISLLANNMIASQALKAFGGAGAGSALANSVLRQSRVKPKDKRDGQRDDPLDGDHSKGD